jgi:hypothetical protein
MATSENLFTARKSLDQICSTPEKIISVYSLEKHVWKDSNSADARRHRQPELQTLEEFQLDPVRPFFTDILRHLAAPYKKDRKEDPVGQGYWIQAEFGSGKSHVLCCLAALALGDPGAWAVVDRKEKKSGRGKRESLYRFWEEGIQAKSAKGSKGIFVIVKTLVGSGGGVVGLGEKGQRLSEYILDAAKEQLQAELGKNLSLYPTEILADRFLKLDLDRHRNDLRKFLRDPRFFEEIEFEDVDKFVQDIQQNKSPEYKRSCGNKLWRFYTEYLEVQPKIAMETEDVLKHLVETILAEGYSGVLLVLDEVSLFMKDRDEDQRVDDEKTLVVLSNRLAKVENLPIWTVCAAQQAIESKMGVKNIIADDRLKLVKLLEEDKDYYSIVLARVREIKDPGAIANYYLHYKKGFTWPNSIGETEFEHFFPFHKPALEVLRAITFELTTARSAIHFMHQTLKHQIKQKGTELVRLWELFDEAVNYEEDPSGVHAGLVAIKTKKEAEYRAYEACRRQIDAVTSGFLKVHRARAVQTIQTLFLYHAARTRQQGLSPEEIANSVLIERQADATPEENIQHYESLAEALKKQVRQVAQTFDEEHKPLYRFDPVLAGVNSIAEFQKARDEAESNKLLQQQAWDRLLTLKEWTVQTRQMKLDLSAGVKSIFRDLGKGRTTISVVWKGRELEGQVSLQDLVRAANDFAPLPAVDTEESEQDFAVYISTKPATQEAVVKLISRTKDPRVLFWTPAELTAEERARLLDFAAYCRLVESWQGKTSDDASTVINWVSENLQTQLGIIQKIVDASYGRGRIDALDNMQMKFSVAGELVNVISPLVDKTLTSAYESRDIQFPPNFVFRKEEAVKVINGIVKSGDIPKGAKPNQNISAAQNFGFGLMIMKKSAERKLDTSGNPYVQDLWSFVDSKLEDEQATMPVVTAYKNFMGIGGPKNYGLSRRMVQIFLLCLVKDGRIRLGVNAKAGISHPRIDYANIGDIDFSAKVLDSLTYIQKMAQPENWEVLRPYAEKLLDESIPATNDDAAISACRNRLHDLFASESDEAGRAVKTAKSLFEELNAANPYDQELQQIATLFASDVSGGEDIALVLHALQKALGYQAFETNSSSIAEVDDLANRLRDYRNLQKFLRFEREVRLANAYATHALPDRPELNDLRRLQQELKEKLANLRPYIDSEVKLKTELVGRIPPDMGESGTLGAFIKEYTVLYDSMLNAVLDQVEGCRAAIQKLIDGDEMLAYKSAEGITALQPPVSAALIKELTELRDSLFSCGPLSRASIEDQLQRGPVHECGLTFANAADTVKQATGAGSEAARAFNDAIDRKIEIFLNPAIRGRLNQGKHEPAIAGLLAAATVDGIRRYLLDRLKSDSGLVSTINRYLKKINVRSVKVSGFKPSRATVEKDQIANVADEFRVFLEAELKVIDDGEDSLPVLQLE